MANMYPGYTRDEKTSAVAETTHRRRRSISDRPGGFPFNNIIAFRAGPAAKVDATPRLYHAVFTAVRSPGKAEAQYRCAPIQLPAMRYILTRFPHTNSVVCKVSPTCPPPVSQSTCGNAVRTKALPGQHSRLIHWRGGG